MCPHRIGVRIMCLISASDEPIIKHMTTTNTVTEKMDSDTKRRLAEIKQDANPLVRSTERLAKIAQLDALLAALRDTSAATVSVREGNA